MNQINRLSQGGRINRGKVVNFRYDNQALQGYEGDTLASALLANGITLVARSFKYHRPRGIYTAGSEEPNALVQLESGAYTEPNRRATEVELYEDLSASSQNCWPSVNFDLGAINARVSRLLPAGFYYKTFMWPASLWTTYEKFIRKAAGLGKSPDQIDPDSYDKLHVHCDVLVVGAGSAGLQAALSAGRSGARVMLIDEKPVAGGALIGSSDTIDGKPAAEWVESAMGELSAMENVTVLLRTTVTGYYDYNFLVANERVSEHLGRDGKGKPKERLRKIRAKQVVLATGSIERPMVFADNDRPGVMLASAIRTYINRFGVLPGKKIAFLTNNDSAYLSALDAKAAGAAVTIFDIRSNPEGALIDRAKADGITVEGNRTITAVKFASGVIKGITTMGLSDDGRDVTGAKNEQECELIGCRRLDTDRTPV